MKKKLFLLFSLAIVCCNTTLNAKVRTNNEFRRIDSLHYTVKTNLLYAATATFPLGFELGIGEKSSLDLSGSWNPWTFSDNKKWKHWAVVPEFRYWIAQRFAGHFVGLHAAYSEFNVGGVALLGLKHERRQGWLAGGGVSYGYVLPLTDKWRLEGTLSVGYLYQDYKRFDCETCGESRGKGTKNYVGPTKLGISLVYGF